MQKVPVFCAPQSARRGLVELLRTTVGAQLPSQSAALSETGQSRQAGWFLVRHVAWTHRQACSMLCQVKFPVLITML